MIITPSKLAMVPFVSVENMMKLVHHIGIEQFMRDLAHEIEVDFKRWELFDKTPRVGSHSAVGVIELMPTSDGELYGFKYVNGHPKNMKEGLQTVTAFGLLADVFSGYPVLLSEMTVLTAQKAVNGITNIRLYDIDMAATEKCAANLAGLGLNVTICTTPEAAIEGAQVITTATADKDMQTILTDNMVGAGVHINAIGGDCPGKTELHRDIVARSTVFVEYPPQTRIEGEIQQMDPGHPVVELWQVMTGAAKGRQSAAEVTLFDGVGFAIEDFSALRYVHTRIKGTAFYDDLDFVADPDDPRDLFGMLQRAKD